MRSLSDTVDSFRPNSSEIRAYLDDRAFCVSKVTFFLGGGNYAICLRVSFSFFFCARFWNSLNILSDFLILGDSGSTTSKLGKAG